MSNWLEKVGVYYTVKINFPDKTWVRAGVQLQQDRKKTVKNECITLGKNRNSIRKKRQKKS
jgi:hypothetical protein